ncbi:acyl-CoA-binding protein [Phascolomyces articulosus]|uniref:Acyl-CoA-binding protein n=1 Tax=Phascolomyces articulosus TaxID=60185 RepID=A0AAD5KBY3_9FUNG|nr:acyl-CoA-binding protein [Phascolomyces articulosus]
MTDYFEQASTFLNTHNVPLSNDQKLKVYSLFKQATVGDCNVSKPSLFEFVGRAKWDAWNGLRGMSTDEAKQTYVETVESFQVGWSRQQGEYEQSDTATSDTTAEANSSGKAVAVSMMAYDGESTEDSADLFGYARQNNLDAARDIISKQKDLVDGHDEDGLTALHHACDRGNLEMVKLLIELGANVNAKTNEQETPLHYGKFIFLGIK